MSRKVFINLPVADLEKSKTFYEALGFHVNPQFTDATGACVVISEEIYVMLLTYPKFSSFTQKTIADTQNTIEVMNALSCDTREAVDELMVKALAAGGRESRKAEDYGFMYSRSVEDLDGHIWEPFWMDPKYVDPK